MMNLPELETKTLEGLMALAKGQSVENYDVLTREELIA